MLFAIPCDTNAKSRRLAHIDFLSRVDLNQVYLSRGHLGGCPIFRVLGQLRQALKNWPFSGSTPGVLLTPVIIKRANPSNYYDKRYPQGKLQWGGDRPTLAGTYSALGGLLRKHKALLRH